MNPEMVSTLGFHDINELQGPQLLKTAERLMIILIIFRN